MNLIEHNRIANEIAATLSDVMTSGIDVFLMEPSAVLNHVEHTNRSQTIEAAFAALTTEVELTK